MLMVKHNHSIMLIRDLPVVKYLPLMVILMFSHSHDFSSLLHAYNSYPLPTTAPCVVVSFVFADVVAAGWVGAKHDSLLELQHAFVRVFAKMGFPFISGFRFRAADA